MATFPINLNGDTLGKRHQYLNTLVDHAYNSDVNFQEIQLIPEHSPVDRLFKIDLASKLRDVDYITKNFKDDDMLYVSRVLKCRWLLDNEYQNIINPTYLEHHLFPHMVTTSVSKMKCWISVNLKDPDRCQKFYEYYTERNFDLAIRFLTHCQVSYILNEMPKLLEKVDPFYFKVFCERTPHVAQIFFDSLMTNEKVLSLYLKNEVEYYNSLRVVLKADSNIFLNITEKYFNHYKFSRLSPSATRFIMNNCRDRFMEKTELYTAWLLDVKTMAECLNSGESKELVIKLARAEYLKDWFSYKEVEPLLKRLNIEERSVFKKKIFVENDIGVKVQDWLYPTPSQPSEFKKSEVFDENDQISYWHYDIDYDVEDDIGMCHPAMACRAELYRRAPIKKQRTVLDQLFDEYRFFSFENTLVELRKKIAAESSPQNRQYMMLVLVSKTGGRVNSVDTLLQLLARHRNEPSHVRATIIRSLVKRAFVWRLPQESWQSFLSFAVGLGLDGKPPEAECREGLHAVILRSLLGNDSLATEIISAYTREFSTLKEYSLTVAELKVVAQKLPELLLTSIVNETNTKKQAVVFDFLFQVLDEYKIPIDTGLVVPALVDLVNRDPSVAESLILQLFRAKKARKELFLENFIYLSTDASYLNALRHNTEVLKIDKYLKRVLAKDSHKEQFLRKLAIYFTETNGLAELYLSIIKQSALKDKPNLKLARPLALLMESKNLEAYLKQLNEGSDKSVRRFAAALTANAHLAKPKLDIDDIGWNAIGAKAVANRVLICRNDDINRHLINLLKSPRTAKLAIALSQRIHSEVDMFVAIGKMRPNVALKCAMKYFHHNPDNFKESVWEIVKPILKKFDFEHNSKKYSSKILWKVERIPLSIRADYCIILYEVAKSKASSKLNFILSHMERLVPKFRDDIIEDILFQFMQSEFRVEKVLKQGDDKMKESCLYLRILIKFIMLSKSAEIQSKRSETFIEPLLATLKAIWDSSESKKVFNTYLKEIFKSLRYKLMFFNEEYISFLPVFKRIVSWMHTILPMEIYFSVYVNLHLTMLYFKTVRQCLKQRPDVFKDEQRKYKEGIDIWGRTFGQYIAKEVDELKPRYFESIVELYGKVLHNYLLEFLVWDPMRHEIFTAVIKGVAECGTPFLAVYLFQMALRDHVSVEISNELKYMLREKKNKEIDFFLDSEEYTDIIIEMF